MTARGEEQEYSRAFDGKLWLKVWRYAGAFHKKMGRVAFLMGLVALCDVLYPQLTRYAIDRFVTGRESGGMLPFIAVYAAVILTQAGSVFGFIYLASQVDNGLCGEIRRRGFQKLQELSFSFYDRTPTGHLMTRMVSDARHLGETFGWGVVDLVWSLVFLLLSLISMAVIHPGLTLLVLITVPPLAAASLYFQRRILAAHREVRRVNSSVTQGFAEGILGAKTSKTLVLEEQNRQDFAALTTRLEAGSVRAARLSSLFLPVVISIGSVATALVLARGELLALRGALSLGSLAAFVGYTLELFHPVRDLAGLFSEMQRMQAAAERVVALIETEPELADTPEVEARFGSSAKPLTQHWPPLRGAVTFENVSFAYRGGETVLEDFSLKVAAGETVALVGHTGAGKSTIVNLVCRFYEPTRGRILIDGVDYRERSLLWLQSNLGYVLQEPHLFSGTVADNIRYGCKDADDAQVARAAALVRADSFISRLKKGYDTPVGEGGGRLSTGEKQLISFARAILKDPRILILDEATSSVDTETEAAIQEAIHRTVRGRTSFIIAHRLSTIRNADRILVIEGGRVSEMGSHRELMALRGAYYHLYTSQFREERSLSALREGMPQA